MRRSHTACLICQAVAMLQGWALLLCTPKQASKPSTWRARLGALSEALGHDLICQSRKAGVGPARIGALNHCKVCTTCYCCSRYRQHGKKTQARQGLSANVFAQGDLQQQQAGGMASDW